MTSRETIDRFLAQRHIAVVGVSRDPKQFANAVYRQLRHDGRVLFPVNEAADGAPIEGDTSYRCLSEVPQPLDGVLVMVDSARAADVVAEAVVCHVPMVWLGRGVHSPEAVALCDDHDVEVIDGVCPLMFDEPVSGIHRLHRFFVGRRVAA
jgi:uncharacterized protein